MIFLIAIPTTWDKTQLEEVYWEAEETCMSPISNDDRQLSLVWKTRIELDDNDI